MSYIMYLRDPYHAGSGALTGNFGYSTLYAVYAGPLLPVADLIGPGFYYLYAILLALILAFSILLALKHWRRPAPYRDHLHRWRPISRGDLLLPLQMG